MVFLVLGSNYVKGHRVTKNAKQIKFEGGWGQLESKNWLQRQQWTKYFRQTAISSLFIQIFHIINCSQRWKELINFFFSGGDREFMGITKYGAIWANSHEKYILSLKLAINYLLNSSYFAIGCERFC